MRVKEMWELMHFSLTLELTNSRALMNFVTYSNVVTSRLCYDDSIALHCVALFTDDITPEPGTEVEEQLDDVRTVTTANEKGRILGSLRLSARPLKSAFRKVERSITHKKTAAEVNAAMTALASGDLAARRLSGAAN